MGGLLKPGVGLSGQFPAFHSIVPALASCARMGHPLLWWCQLSRSPGHPPPALVMVSAKIRNPGHPSQPSEFTTV